MKVTTTVLGLRALASLAVAVAIVAATSFTLPQQASATPRRAKTITRSEVMKRARTWVKHRVPYSQRSYHQGYRQDCSGFVSMAWRTGRSYSSRTIDDVSYRVPRRKAKVGDAVLTPGHVAIFGGWKNKKARTYYAYEARSWGKPAARSVRTMKRGAKVLRRRGIRDQVRRAPSVLHRPRGVQLRTLMPNA